MAVSEVIDCQLADRVDHQTNLCVGEGDEQDRKWHVRIGGRQCIGLSGACTFPCLSVSFSPANLIEQAYTIAVVSRYEQL